jgi:agmatine deiminase
MPGEFAPHERTVVCWPARPEIYEGRLALAEEAHALVAETIAGFEPVTVIVDPADAERARARLSGSVDVVECPIDDAWFRDTGPIFVVEDGERVATHWRFNGWGGKFSPCANDAAVGARWAESAGHRVREVDMVLEGGSITSNGDGVLATTMQCLLHPSRNPDLSMGAIEENLRRELGAEAVLWLPHGLSLDRDTDGHVDNVAAFVASGHLVLQGCEDPDEEDHARMRVNAAVARREAERLAARTGNDIEVSVVPVLPFAEAADERIVVPYLNFYVGNGFVLIPTCGHRADDEMVSLIGSLFPGRRAIGLPVGEILAVGGGGIHCITQQVPAA